ncbi:MAG: Com family DNA-binding transcriptional regulator [Alphaproteobacteria bacterium]|uniref:Com family DNA-binding transcriptional regulator n=1 Tax=Candidatus Nitrobium versatile TaxID=2884831 RepID=A0A953M2M8_9BACT|nr:Com family DNA-binding transcriptional regulator [Candidatus Nitrobium versatile]
MGSAIQINEIRCKRCRRLLLKGDIRLIEIKCPKCGYLQKIGNEEVSRDSNSQ